LYNASTEDSPSSPSASKYLRLGVILVISIAIFVIVGSKGVELSMNITEFDDKFIKPLLYSIISSLFLSTLAFVRINIVSKKSIFWYLIYTIINILNDKNRDSIINGVSNFNNYKLSTTHFIIWQLTKVLLFGAFFSNIMFGFALTYISEGNSLGIDNSYMLFNLPFVTPPTDPSYSIENVVPMIPALLIVFPPILAAIGIRLILYVGIDKIISILTSYVNDSLKGKLRYLDYVSTVEIIIGISIMWFGFNLFFTDHIDYNTRYSIAGTFAIGLILLAFSFLDKIRSKVFTHILKRDIYMRIGIILAIIIVIVAIMAVNNSIADARKIEYLGPYTSQQIAVNRYLGDLETVEENNHDISIRAISPNHIQEYIQQNKDLLDVIRIWDWDAAFAKLKPEIGLIPYVDFEDNDILRFNDSLYWTASMKPILPQSVSTENRWYNEHLVYTHVPNGFLTLNATNGQIVDSGEFFKQRAIYYGEGGLLDLTWSAYPENRNESSAELNNSFYSGNGGLNVSPPLSWIFEPNFLLSFPTDSIHVMRFKDVNERMNMLYPYFLYNLFGKELDTFPVTDGENSYWLIPLIIGFDTHNVPWSVGNPYLRLVGYALIDTYNGDISLLKSGDDFFSNMFASKYNKQFIETPIWLENQIRYPQELFNWKTEMYNIYHVTDIEKFIQANEFYEIPLGLSTYYIEAKPPGFSQHEFLGLLSLELRGSQGRNLAGYMIVENDLNNLGKMQFYEIPLDSTTKLIGPTAVREALDRDPDFAQLKTLLRNPRIGDNILYKVGDHDVYFIPVYTAGSGGVVAQLGTIAAVGAAFTGEYYVGLGDTQEKAFEEYLKKLSGVTTEDLQQHELNKASRIDILKSIFQNQQLDIILPTSIQIPLSFQEREITFFTENDLDFTKTTILEFIDDFVKPRNNRIIMWQSENIINFGTIMTTNNFHELHYISVNIGE